ncbi:UDP-N-acetylmuramate dehydrogenase [Neobacillus mesonae]|nr:UDP-N-acetylmuramate dehydrogenase [Neobacillus mesonae]
MNTQRQEKLIQNNVDLSSYSTYEIGGKAKYLAAPGTIEELKTVLEYARQNELAPFLFGMGSNILFPDEPMEKMIFISLKELKETNIDEKGWFVSAGMPMSHLALIGLASGTSDYDFCFLLPGTVGAGVYMNAKYYNRQICDILDTALYIDMNDPEFKVQSIHVDTCDYSYKNSIFMKNNWTIVGAYIKHPNFEELSKGIKEISRLEKIVDYKNPSELPNFFKYYTTMAETWAKENNGQVPESFENVVKDRGSKFHFDYPSCGSVFKNNYDFGEPMGKVVDRLNMRGTVRGGASISAWHGNMIVNQGEAKAEDIVHLIDQVKKSVKEAFDFVPEEELIIVQSKS